MAAMRPAVVRPGQARLQSALRARGKAMAYEMLAQIARKTSTRFEFVPDSTTHRVARSCPCHSPPANRRGSLPSGRCGLAERGDDGVDHLLDQDTVVALAH